MIDPSIRVLGAHLRGKHGDSNLATLQRPAFREAMMHGINCAARWALVSKVIRPLAALREQIVFSAVVCRLRTIDLRSILASDVIDRVTIIGACTAKFGTRMRQGPDEAVAVLSAMAVRRCVIEVESRAEAERRMDAMARRRRARTLLTGLLGLASRGGL